MSDQVLGHYGSHEVQECTFAAPALQPMPTVADLVAENMADLEAENAMLRTALRRIADYKKTSDNEDDYSTILTLQAIADDAVCPKVMVTE